MPMDVFKALKNMISAKHAEDIMEELKNFKYRVKEQLGTINVDSLDNIDGIDGAIGVFTDGSNVVSERRGAGVAIFSAASLLFEISGKNLKFRGKHIITPNDCILIIIPRFYIGTRANTIMRGIEYLSTLHLISTTKDIDFAIIDGSYVSTLLSARWGIEHLYRDFYNTLTAFCSSSKTSKKPKTDIIVDICESISDATNRILSNHVFRGLRRPQSILSNFCENYAEYISMIYEAVVNNHEIPEPCYVSLMNYVSMFFEINLSMKALVMLLNNAHKRRLVLLWLNKEPESRILTKNVDHKLFRMFTDATVLDFSLDNGEFLHHYGLPSISPSGIYISKTLASRTSSSSHVLIPELADVIYGIYGEYGVVYVKYLEYVIQYTYPRTLFGVFDEERLKIDEAVLKYIKLLGNISDVGYPLPMIHAHNTTVLKAGLAEILADKFTEILSLDPRLSQLARRLIGKTGRRLIGI